MLYKGDVALEEMHIIAYVYHWDRNSLWKLPCKERRAWIRLIAKQKKAEGDAIKKSSKSK